MRKLVAALALSTSALAITSVYLWMELREARQNGAQGRPGIAAVQPVHSMQRPHVVDDREASAGPPDALDSNPAAGDADDRQRIIEQDVQESARRTLAQLSDPTMRAQILEEWIEANLPQKTRYARYVGISEADAERLIGVLAERNVEQSEAYARCMLQPPCDLQAIARQMSAAEQQAITDLLGTEKQQRFEEYTYSGVERGLVKNFLSQKIPTGNQLSEEELERLVAALAAERRLVEAEIRQRGLEPFSFPMEGVAFVFPASLFEAGNASERLKEAAEFNQRIHARAKLSLSPKQLAAFEEMQQAGIVGLKYWLRKQERDLATQAISAGQGR